MPKQPTPPPPSLSEIPDVVFSGDYLKFLEGLKPEVKNLVCVFTLKLLSGARMQHAEDGEMLRALTRMEVLISGHVIPMTTQKPTTTVYGSPPTS